MGKPGFAEKFTAKYQNYTVTEKTEYWTEHWDETVFNYEGIYLTVENPYGGENIRIMYDGDHVTDDEIIISFSYFHTHIYIFPEYEIEDHTDFFVREVSKVVDLIVQSKLAAVGFLVDGKSIWGDAENPDKIKALSAEEIFETYKVNFPDEKYYEKVKGRDCVCSIRAWDKTHDNDMNFIIT